MKIFLVILIFLLCNSTVFYGQKPLGKNTFEIHGQIYNRDTGKIVLRYFDARNKFQSDTTKLLNGKFYFNGTVNGACEGMLWTNVNNINFGDISVHPFLIEPGKILIIGTDSNLTITGQIAEQEKQKWDLQKVDLTNYKTALRKIGKPASEIQQVNEEIKKRDLEYIDSHLESYLSGYLLFNQKRRLRVDSLQMYYSKLSIKVKESNIGKRVLGELYPLTTDEAFKKLNPYYSIEFQEKLGSVTSVYDFTLMNNLNKEISLKTFKGKYLILDFWASWCSPCIANFPTQKQLINIYKNEPIDFISISLDTDVAKWKMALKKYNLDGVQLIAPKAFDELIAAYFKIISVVPQYVIIDPQGAVINLNAPQPLDPAFKILIDKILSASVGAHTNNK